MKNGPDSILINAQELVPGMFVHIPLGWMDHPFARNRFRIESREQVRIIQSLGLREVKVFPELSDPLVVEKVADAAPLSGAPPAAAEPARAPPVGELSAEQRRRAQALAHQRTSLARCERQFSAALLEWRDISNLAARDPGQALSKSELLLDGLIGEMSADTDTHIRLLSESAGDAISQHALNVTILSLMLAKGLGLPDAACAQVGMGALLHDIGKLSLPQRLRIRSDRFSAVEERAFREHVSHGVQLGREMGLSASVLDIIAQHHEFCDTTGYPARLDGDHIAIGARLVGQINLYDNLINPPNPVHAMTPHEALAAMFSQMKPRFDPRILSAMIRLMGVYPPGSVVQLSDQRFAMVVSVNGVRPLKPKVIVHDPHIPPDLALVIDLEDTPQISIRRSVHLRHLNKDVIEYLSPRQRVCYFFERAMQPLEEQEA